MKLLLDLPEGYDRATQALVATFAASLDDQLRRLREEIAGLEVRHLEWQERPGRNTIGMLLTHLALVEWFWFTFAPSGRSWGDDGHDELRELIGVHDDGLPLAKDGKHPDYLAGFTLETYDDILSRARARIHDELRTWTDASLDDTYQLQGREKTRDVSRRWTLYHVLEHFAAHFGQISLLKHLMRDAGVLAEREPQR